MQNFFLQKNVTSKIQSNNKSITDKVRESKTFDEDSNIFTFGGEEVDRAYISCPDMLDISQPNLSSYVSLSKSENIGIFIKSLGFSHFVCY